MVYISHSFCKTCGARWTTVGNDINFEYIDAGCECESAIVDHQKSLDILGLKAIYARLH